MGPGLATGKAHWQLATGHCLLFAVFISQRSHAVTADYRIILVDSSQRWEFQFFARLSVSCSRHYVLWLIGGDWLFQVQKHSCRFDPLRRRQEA